VKQLAEDPLRKPDTEEEEEETLQKFHSEVSDGGPQLEVWLLEIVHAIFGRIG
jgi:hypothetical protein